jgi:hypothetical protein
MGYAARRSVTPLKFDNDTYLTKHTEAGYHCNFIGIESDTFKVVRKAGKIPRFLAMTCADAPSDLEIKSIDFGTYIVLSHVWAHELGDSHNNSFSICHIHRLLTYVSSLKPQFKEFCAHKSMGLRIDTLGEPLKHNNRKLALRALQRTYADSTGDEELYRASGKCFSEEMLLGWLCQPDPGDFGPLRKAL